ncbi:hypothetical protein ACJ41O_005513 [Fusarium nematophilum]
MPGKARAFDTWARDQRLLDATIKHMDSKSCAALYKVNMAFRQSLAPSKWESVRFQDTEAQLVEQLSNLLSYPPESRKYLHHHIKNASIIILAHGPADGAVQRWKRVSDFPLLPPEVDGLPKLILDAITSMPQLQSLTIDVWAFRDKQVNEFTRLLAENWRWKWKLNHLNILAHDDIIRDIINHCDSDELRGLHLYTGTGSVAWKAAKKHVRLERLRLHLDRVVETETPTRSMNARILHEIAFLFPGIRWLTLCEVERNYAKCNQLRTREHKAEFANQKDALAKALARFVHLERFAFTLPKSRIANRFICSGLGVAEDKSPREYEWDQFYAGVIKDITKSAPRVREVCVFKEFPYLYRATRTRDGGAFTLRRERRVQPVTLTATCLGTCKKLSDLAGSYEDVPVVIAMICSESTVISIALSQLQMHILKRQDLSQAWASRSEVLMAFETALTGCMVVFSCLEAETRQLQLQTSKPTGLRVWTKLRFMWNQDRLKELLGALRGQQTSINFLLQVLEIDTLSEIQKTVRNNRSSVQMPASEAQSLRSRNPSVRIASSIFDNENQRVSLFEMDAVSAIAPSELDFEFDDMVLNSQAYRRAFARAQAEAEQQPTIVEGDLIDLSEPALDDNADAETIRQVNQDLEGLNFVSAPSRTQSLAPRPLNHERSRKSIGAVFDPKGLLLPPTPKKDSDHEEKSLVHVKKTPDEDLARRPTASAPRYCGKCSEPLVGEYIKAFDQGWHLECFTCLDCNEPVKRYFVRDEDPTGPFCETDYFRRLDLLCHDCGRALRGSYITSFDKKFHPEHFSCHECKTVIGPEDSYYEHEKEAYCLRDYCRLHAQRCSGCRLPIVKQFVEPPESEGEGGKTFWHPECYMVKKAWTVSFAPPLWGWSSSGEYTMQMLERHELMAKRALDVTCNFCDAVEKQASHALYATMKPERIDTVNALKGLVGLVGGLLNAAGEATAGELQNRDIEAVSRALRRSFGVLLASRDASTESKAATLRKSLQRKLKPIIMMSLASVATSQDWASPSSKLDDFLVQLESVTRVPLPDGAPRVTARGSECPTCKKFVLHEAYSEASQPALRWHRDCWAGKPEFLPRHLNLIHFNTEWRVRQMAATRKHQNCAPLRVLLWSNSWLDEKVHPADFIGKDGKPHPLRQTDSHVTVIFANADKVRECPSCRQCFNVEFQMPELWWSTYAKRSNGYFGSETFRDNEGSVTSITSWCRFLVKQLSEHYHEWYKFNIFARWSASTHQTTLLIFDGPKQSKLSEAFPKLLDGSQDDPLKDPFWIYVRLLEELSRLQDIAVWTIRNGVRAAEHEREPRGKPNPDYSRLHDLSRHAIHVQETLEVSAKSVASLITHHTTFMEEALFEGWSRSDLRQVRSRLLWHEHILQSLQSRASSNKERLLNEIQLAFNTVAQYDARISVQIGRATQSDSAAMKTIAFATLAFLPATFISAVFSTSFFRIEDDTGRWAVSDKFWVYWAFAVPVTVLTTGLWFWWRRTWPPVVIGEEEGPGEKKSLFREKTCDSRGLLGGKTMGV